MAFDPDQYLAKKQSQPEQQSAGFDPDAYIQKKQQAQASGEERPWYSLDPSNLGAGFMAGLEKIDEYTGAPIRKAITETVTGEEFAKAPTGAQQAEMLGATDVSYGDALNLPEWVPGREISPADIYGVGLDLVQDPFVIGGALKKGLSTVGKGVQYIDDAVRGGSKTAAKGAQSQVVEGAAEAGARSGAQVSGGGIEFEQSGKLFEKTAPRNIEEMRSWEPKPGTGELAAKSRLKEVEKVVTDLETKPTPYHYRMLDNPKAMKEMKIQFENLPTKDAKKMAAYNQQMVDESAEKITQTINQVSGGFEPRVLSDAGDDLIDTVKTKYNAEKDMLGPAFQELKKTGGMLSPDESRDLVQGIGESSNLGKLMGQTPETGRLFLKKNSPRSGISAKEHGVLSKVIDDLNDGMSFEELQKTRDFLRKEIDPANQGATAEINKVRSLMLGQMEEMAAKRGPKVGETFKAYAVNERARENIEKIIGGQVENFDAMFSANPERVLKKVFANPNHTKLVRDYVGPEKMQEMVGAYINDGLKKAYDPTRGFNPSHVRNWLQKNENFLRNNVEPEVAERLNALADYGYMGKRFLDEVNPSGTAASLAAMFEPRSLYTKLKSDDIKAIVVSETLGRVGMTVKQRQAVKAFDESLRDMPPEQRESVLRSLLEKLDTGAKKTGAAVDDTVNAQTANITFRNTYKDTSGRMSAKNEEDKAPKPRPLKGNEKWASDGYDKIIKANPALKGRLSPGKENKKINRLLIEASGLKPGSKAMNRVMKQLEEEA